jgi:possible beta-fructofuranosidase
MKQISNEISKKISKKLSLARFFEKAHFSEIQRQERPGFHLSPALGWLNDPNGFSIYKGEYHLFYQYNPYSTRWDAMHWGHWTSKDLLHWDYQEASLAPDEDYETGVFSGTAIADKDGSHLIMYTADYTKVPDYSTDLSGKNGIRRETQCIAKGYGREYQKFEGNPVLSEKDLPEEFTIEDFRDPKLWIGKDGKYYAVTVARKKRDNLGAALLFSSENAVEWQYLDTIRENDGSFGGMWECPDFFFLEGRPVLSLSVMNMKNTSPLFRNGNCTVAFVGEEAEIELEQESMVDLIENSMKTAKPQALDLGFDFYAPQTMERDGRTIMVGWMQAPEAGGNAPENDKWYGQMSFPRELFFLGDRLCQRPIPEIQKLYKDRVELAIICEKEEKSFAELEDKLLDLSLRISASKDCLKCQECSEQKVVSNRQELFQMKFAKCGENYVLCTYDFASGILTVDRSHAGRSASICEVRRIYVGSAEELSLRLLLDRFSFELFVNDGEQALSGTLYELPAEAKEISFQGEGIHLQVEKHSLREIELGEL